ncbi:MAG TPA: calcium/sodium antiporter [Saprospiraceae bacterium]|nr:calcium/sodium antiporter [Saprospiraceae bacterium]HNT19091.1 calcium/sodium antiporter [Saprospiraceae bacterium]
MFLSVILLLLGFGILVKGADFLVKGASSVAKRKGISNLAIGLTVVAFGTSMPELTVSVLAALEGRNDASFGNVIGSNNFNLLFILGVAGLLYPLAVHRNTVNKEIPISLGAAFLLWFLVNDSWNGMGGSGINGLSRLDALILLIFFSAFIYYVYLSMKEASAKNAEEGYHQYSMPFSIIMILGGLAALIGGGKLVVDHAVNIAQYFGWSEKLIGLTILAIGTSLPELATSAVAAYHKHDDIAIGNVIGSNIFNIFFILGITGMIHPIDYNTEMNRDIYVLIAGTLALMVFLFILTRHKLDRWKAFIMLAAYILYTGYLIKLG